MKRFAAVFWILVLLLTGCKPSTVAYEKAGVILTLPEDFQDVPETADGMVFNYTSQEIGLCGITDNKAELMSLVGPMELKDYMALVAKLNQVESGITQRDGLYTFTYEVTSQGKSYTYVAVGYEDMENFYLIQGYCKTAAYERLQDTIWQYLSTAKIA